ncbi:MAG: septal ring lytic transglycosylase RlpA family protein [bacterium]|nr:septal ring lytic transglycosylase RlpA family protein [bacterium]
MLDSRLAPTSPPAPRRPVRLAPRLRVVHGGRRGFDSIDQLRERRLMLAALDDAVRTILGSNPAFDGRPVDRRRELAWLRSRTLRHPFTFERICMRLGFDPDRLRRRILCAARRAGTLALLLALLAARPAAAEPLPHLGTASWYGWEFAGRRTACGERFDPRALTAAHRTLPLGTNARITNLRNGRIVVVRITDRGPYVEPRVLDLSLAAAHALDMVDCGVADVLIEPL